MDIKSYQKASIYTEKGLIMKYIDLHVHSTASDGSYTPAEIIACAEEKELSAIALTDHDTIKGLYEASEAAKGRPLELVAGIELSADYNGTDIHILGLYLDYKKEAFQKELSACQDAREHRNEKIIMALQKVGFDITLEKIEKSFHEAVITRAHFARYLLEKGYIRTYEEAFEKYLGVGCPCYVPKKKIIPEKAIELIHMAGGIAVLAHPLLYHMDSTEVEKLVSYLKTEGLEGLEAIYSMNSEQDTEQMIRLAKKYDLLITGGSDFHGTVKPHIDMGYGRGNLRVPEYILEGLRNKKK